MTTAETQELGPDQLDVLAEEHAVTAINETRHAIAHLESFDHQAHAYGVASEQALTSLRDARAAVDAAMIRCIVSAATQKLADVARAR